MNALVAVSIPRVVIGGAFRMLAAALQKYYRAVSVGKTRSHERVNGQTFEVL